MKKTFVLLPLCALIAACSARHGSEYDYLFSLYDGDISVVSTKNRSTGKEAQCYFFEEIPYSPLIQDPVRLNSWAMPDTMTFRTLNIYVPKEYKKDAPILLLTPYWPQGDESDSGQIEKYLPGWDGPVSRGILEGMVVVVAPEYFPGDTTSARLAGGFFRRCDDILPGDSSRIYTEDWFTIGEVQVVEAE